MENNKNRGYIESIHIPIVSTPPTIVRIAHRKQILPKIKYNL